MEEQIDTPQEFSLLRRAKSFVHAGRGLWLFLRVSHSSWIQVVVLGGVIALGVYFDITATEWILLVLASGFVLCAEAFNTAIEIDINLTSPQYHPYARDTKDVAAGAVLLASIVAVVVGLIIFVPYVAPMVRW
jgi:diacylglycerol kinase (ATP)